LLPSFETRARLRRARPQDDAEFVSPRAHVGALPYYRWIYRTVLADWHPLGALYADRRLAPVRPATAMSPEDLALAGRMDEATP
jgi:hypothetical protein